MVAVVLFALVLSLNFGCGASATSAFVDAGLVSPQTAKNRAAIQAAKVAIEEHRKGDVTITVVDQKGRLVPDARLEITQLSHAFKFGCYLKIDDLDQAKLANYQDRLTGLFNYAVIGTYWDAIEPKRGHETWDWFDREAELAGKLGLEIQAAPVLWGTNKFGAPAWLPRDGTELKTALDQRVKSTVSRNAAVTDWEIVNEPLAPKKDSFSSLGTDEYISSAFRTAKEAAPNARLMINEYGVFGSVAEHNYNRDRYFDLTQRLIANSVPIDIIGIQAHANGEWYEPANVAEQLDHYAALGKPIQITEFSAQTADYKDRRSPLPISGGDRPGVWDATKQAEFYREFYTVAFANPKVEAIVTWGLDDERAWLPGIGLIDANGEPKPAYKELDLLINNEWKTRLNGETDKTGSSSFRGFFGNYEIAVISNSGKRSTAKFKLTAGNKNEWLIRINS